MIIEVLERVFDRRRRRSSIRRDIGDWGSVGGFEMGMSLIMVLVLLLFVIGIIRRSRRGEERGGG